MSNLTFFKLDDLGPGRESDGNGGANQGFGECGSSGQHNGERRN